MSMIYKDMIRRGLGILTGCLLWLLTGLMPAFGQQGIHYAVRLLPDKITYQVSLSSTVTFTGAQQITNSGQVTIVGLAGRLSITNVQSVNGQWSNNTTVRAPSQNPGYDYFIFGLTPNTPMIPYSSTQETVLFTFQSSGACPGGVEIWTSTDPFRPNPPTQTINVGNDLTALGFRNGSTLYNAWLGNYNVGQANCETPSTVTLRVKALLQGALAGTTDGLMRDDLRTGGVLPLATPYSSTVSTRFSQTGGGGNETAPAAVTTVTGANAIVDWVLVELRNPANMSAVVATRSGLLQRDGDIVSPADGTSPLSFTGLSGSNFYVSVKHRNHLGVMTAAPQALSATISAVDFTTLAAANVWSTTANGYDYNGYEMVSVGGKNALWAGDANHDGKVVYTGLSTDLNTIFTEVLTAPGNTVNQLYNYNSAVGYYYGDVNMNGKVSYQAVGNDSQTIFTNLLTNYLLNSAKLYNFTFFVEQIPN